MSIRGDLSRKKILQASRELFAAKGFSAVTMQDICHSTGLSRGGLYRHYASTAEVFAAIIDQEQAQALTALDDAKNQKIPPQTIVYGFLQSRMHQLLDPTHTIDNATAEFAAGSPEGKALLTQRARLTLEILSQLLQLGVEQGVFHCENCRETALHILCFLEGMGKHHALLPMREEEVQAQMGIIRQLLEQKNI